MDKDQYLRGKLAIVTGASKPSGIGAATAIALAERGANVGDFDTFKELAIPPISLPPPSHVANSS